MLGLGILFLALMQFYVAFQNQAAIPPSSLPNLETSIAADTTVIAQQQHQSKLYHVGQFGLGHRLSKLSASYHLATHQLLNVSLLELHWGSCQTAEKDIFAFLFGTHQLPLTTATTTATTTTSNQQQEKTILIRNDVAGYYAGQNYKNAHRPLPRAHVRNVWLPKLLQIDPQLFRDLLQRFERQHPDVLEFQKDWEKYTVIGLHIRAGNGEGDHFQQAKRGVGGDLHDFVQGVCQLLVQLPVSKPSLLFVATDTPSVIEMLRKGCSSSFEVRVLPQPRVATKGVSYQAWKTGEVCFQGWRASMMDMALLAKSDILVAGMRSTFTQILPRSLCPQFCEVDVTGRRMTCFTNQTEWLLREHPGQIYSLDNNTNPVVHKVLVHLPDWETNDWIQQASEFLQTNDKESTVFVYGPRFDPKYRGKGQFREEWTWDG